MKRRIFTALAAATIVLGVSGCASMRMDRVAGDLRTALAGEPVIVTTKDDTLTMVSSADYLYPSGGWELRPGAPVLAKMAPTLAGLRNTNIIVSGYTDSTPIGPQLKRMGDIDQQGAFLQPGGRRGELPRLQGRQPEPPLGAGLRRGRSGGLERHARRPGQEPPDRDHAAR